MLTAIERQQRATLAAFTRHHRGDVETIQLARDFKAARLEDYIRRTVADAPPLTRAQRDKLALLLRGDPSEAIRAA